MIQEPTQSKVQQQSNNVPTIQRISKANPYKTQSSTTDLLLKPKTIQNTITTRKGNYIPIIIETNSLKKPRILLIRRSPKPQQQQQTQRISIAKTTTNVPIINSSCVSCSKTARIPDKQTIQQISNLKSVSTHKNPTLRLPFLPAPAIPTPSVKQALPLTNGSVQNVNLKTNSKDGTREQIELAVNSRILNVSNYQQQLNTPNRIHNLFISQQLATQQRNQQKQQQQIQIESNSNNSQNTPTTTMMTLATMAGIQLTGADEMSLTDMSGAMSPTATVEEIDVPVFIDEYLQDQTEFKAFQKITAATNINNNYNNQNNNNNKQPTIIHDGKNNGNNDDDIGFEEEEEQEVVEEEEGIKEEEISYSNSYSSYSSSNTNNNNINNTTITSTNNNSDNNNNSDINNVTTYANFAFDFEQIAEELNNSIKEEENTMYFEDNKSFRSNTSNNSDNSNSNNINSNNNTTNQLNLNNMQHNNWNLLEAVVGQANADIKHDDEFYNAMLFDNSYNNNNSSNNTSSSYSNTTTTTEQQALPQQFHISPSVLLNNDITFNSQDESFINNNDDFFNIIDPEVAIDINTVCNNDCLSLADSISSSQNNLMFNATMPMSITKAEPLLHSSDAYDLYDLKEFSKATIEEIEELICATTPNTLAIPPATAAPVAATAAAMPSVAPVKLEPYNNSFYSYNDVLQINCHDENALDAMPAATPSPISLPISTYNLKRTAATSDSGIQQKRLKLQLDTAKAATASASAFELKTPDVVNLINEMRSIENEQSMDNISICNTSTAPASPMDLDILDVVEILSAKVNGEVYADTTDTTSLTIYPSSFKYCDTDEESPYTPHSFTSSTTHTNQTHYTGDYTTSPNSPADSSTTSQYYAHNTSSSSTTTTKTRQAHDSSFTASNSSSSSKNKRSKRGRPAKPHSDRPDPEQLRRLPESERKKREDRAKNNEASRQSRLKNKQREEEEMREEEQLEAKNVGLKAELEDLTRLERKFKRYLQRNFNCN